MNAKKKADNIVEDSALDNRRGPRVAEEVSLTQLEEVGRMMVAQGTRLISNLETVRKVTGLTALEVKNLPSLDQAFDKLTSFLGAVEKASSRAILTAPVRKEVDRAWATQKSQMTNPKKKQ